MPLPEAEDYALSQVTVLNEGYKGLLAVHGGAIAAMLAFGSQAATRSEALLQAVFIALAVFALGLTLALATPLLRFIISKAAESRDRPPPEAAQIPTRAAAGSGHPERARIPSRMKTAAWFAYTSCQYLSVAAFLAGIALVAYVGYTEAGAIHRMAVSACR